VHDDLSDLIQVDLGRDEALVGKVLGDDLDGTLDVNLVSLDVDLGVGRGLVRCRDTGEFC
jgi:hypothetical protein